MNIYLKFIAFIFIQLLLTLPSFALDTCQDCVSRKKNLCAQECLLVDKENNLRCQKDCSYEYCKHRCKEGDKALTQINTASCSQCLEREYNTCQNDCSIGTERKRAVCKIACSDSRCEKKCSATNN